MAKAKIELPNGTIITVEGSVDEVQQIADLYSTKASQPPPPKKSKPKTSKGANVEGQGNPLIEPHQVVNAVWDADFSEKIESEILDKRDQRNRILLVIYMAQEVLGFQDGLTSGEISEITDKLGVKIKTPNVSGTLGGNAKSYVAQSSTRKKGAQVRYKLNRRGVKQIKELLSIG